MNLPAAFLSEGRNLDDWLSPILVKELRQGMRARVFVISFLMLQVFLVFLVLGNVAAQGDYSTLQFQNSFFWVIVGFALLVLMPMRGLVTVSMEVKNHTLETIMLTRLTAWRVIFGKWSALFAQSLLFVSAVLPYVFLRYFVGGDDVVSDLKGLLFLLWLSGVLIAAGIAISAVGNPVIRVVVLVAIIILMVSGATDSFAFRGLEFPAILVWLCVFGLFIPAVLFEITASVIAPAAENHAFRRRVLGLLFYLVSCAVAWLMHESFRVGIIIPLVVLIGICYFELSERPRLLPRLIHSMAGKGLLGKIAALFLVPGWPSGLLFSLVVIPSAMALCFHFLPPRLDYPWILIIFAIFGSVLVPAFICHLFWPKTNQVLLMVLLYNVVLMGLAALLEGLFGLMHQHADVFLAFFPSLSVLYVAPSADSSAFSNAADWYLIGNLIVMGVLLIGLFMGSRSYFRELFALFRSANTASSSSGDQGSGRTTP